MHIGSHREGCCSLRSSCRGPCFRTSMHHAHQHASFGDFRACRSDMLDPRLYPGCAMPVRGMPALCTQLANASLTVGGQHWHAPFLAMGSSVRADTC